MATMIRVLFDVFRKVAEFLANVNAVYAGLNLNPAYPDPPVSMPEFRLMIDNYAAALSAALDGGAKAIAHRNALEETLWRMLRQLGHYVEANCNDDMTTFLSSGFRPISNVRTRVQPASGSIRRIVPGPLSGQVSVTPVADREAVAYELRWAPILSGGTPGDWTSQTVVGTRPSAVIPGLTPGTTYAFQARALIKSGFKDWSDSVTRICT